MQTATLTYGLGQHFQKLTFESPVLEHFQKFKQLSPEDLEGGGQLFATFTAEEILVKMATGPYKEDHRKKFLFWPLRKKSQQDIDHFFSQGLHYIGDWHTHPQEIPIPSAQDNFSMKDKYIKSQHELKAFMMVIVGCASFPQGLWVSIHDKNGKKKLEILQNNIT